MREAVYPLSPLQRRLHGLFAGPNVTARAELTLPPASDPGVLATALERVVGRHEILRTAFPRLPGMDLPVQEVTPPKSPVVTCLDLTAVSQEARESAVEALWQQLRQCGAADGRMRAHLLRLEPGRNLLWVTLSRLQTDPFTFRLLADELAMELAGQSNGTEPLQYADLSAWLSEQEADFAGDDVRPQRARVEQAVDERLPWSAEVAPDSPFVPRTVPVQLAIDEARRLATGMGTAGPREVLLAVWGALLGRHLGLDDVVVAVATRGRDYVELSEALGPLAQARPLVLPSVAAEPFRSVVARISAAWAEAEECEETVSRVLSPTSWLPFGFVAEDEAATGGSPGLRVTRSECSVERFDLALAFREGDRSDVALELLYDPRVLMHRHVQRLADQTATLVTSALATPDAPLDALALQSAAERQEVVLAWNDQAGRGRGVDVVERVLAHAAERPEGRALLSGKEEVSYDELATRVLRRAGALKAAGMEPESLVGIVARREPETVVAMLAVLAAGGAYLPLDPGYPRRRLQTILEDAKVKLLLTEREAAGRFEDFAGSLVLLDDTVPDAPMETPAAADPRALAYVLYTSGSTGRPKGVAVTRGGLANYLGWCLRAYDLGRGRQSLVGSSFGFDLTVTGLLAPLAGGGSVTLLGEDEDPVRGLADRLRHGGGRTLLKITPSHLDQVGRELGAPPEVSALVTLVVGGEALRGETTRSWIARGSTVFNEYGPTEAVVGCSVHRLTGSDGDRGAVPIGRPIDGARLYLLDRRLELVPCGAAGEIGIAGAGLARGYLGKPRQTAERFLPDPLGAPGERLYRSGDLARQRPDGELEFLGRDDHQVKVRGHRVELGEIEAALVQHPSVRQAALVHVEGDAPGEERLAAYVVPLDEPPTVPVLREFLAERLPEYMLPHLWSHLPALPLTPHGKLDRRALPAPETSGAGPYRPPRNETEASLAALWEEVLRVERVGIEDDFFDLGGHSLLATRVVSRIRRRFGTDMTVRAFLDCRTVAALAAELERARPAEKPSEPPLEPLPRRGPAPLSFAQERLWFSYLVDPDSAAYNIATALRVTGPLDHAAFVAALFRLARRHETLRTRFLSVGDGEGAQEVVPPATLVPACVDLSGLAGPRRELETRRLATSEANRPFDLQQAPLVRVRTLRLADREHAVLFTLHHAIADGWSLEILVREFAALYDGCREGRWVPLPPLPIQYSDFATWQRRWSEAGGLAPHLAYWRRQLHGLPQGPMIPPDFAPGTRSESRGGGHVFRIQAPIAARLEELASAEGATPFMVLLAAFFVLIHRETLAEDLVVGTDVANRTRLETEGLIGFFVNHLVLRGDLSGNPTFRELLHRVRQTTLDAYAHQDLPFSLLVRELRPRRHLDRTPLFQTLFVLQNQARADLRLSGLELAPLDFEYAWPKFDVALFLTDDGEGLHGRWSYRTALFRGETIAHLTQRYLRLLDQLSEDLEQRLSRLDTLNRLEKERRAMESSQIKQNKLDKLRAGRRRSVDLAALRPVTTEPLGDGPLPLVVRPGADDTDLVQWATEERDLLEGWLVEHGGLLFRGFGLRAVGEFERFAQAVCGELYDEYGDLPQEEEGRQVYRSTPYPPDKTILFHNESSHMHRWPMKQLFFCVQAARERGETPLVDCRELYRRLDPEIRDRFERQGLLYVRNFIDGLDVSWRDFFGTDDREAVERYCAAAGMEIEWRPRGLQTRQRSPAVLTHPRTGEKVFFNQVQLHHVSSLDSRTRASMAEVFGEEDLPRNVHYGDGTPIPTEVMEEVGRLYEELAVDVPWQEGDVVLLDNMLAAHGRRPFVGPRKIVVAMGQMMSLEDARQN